MLTAITELAHIVHRPSTIVLKFYAVISMVSTSFVTLHDNRSHSFSCETVIQTIKNHRAFYQHKFSFIRIRKYPLLYPTRGQMNSVYTLTVCSLNLLSNITIHFIRKFPNGLFLSALPTKYLDAKFNGLHTPSNRLNMPYFSQRTAQYDKINIYFCRQRKIKY